MRPAAATRSDRVPILTYHDLGDGPAPLSIRPARFRDHLRSLRASGWTTLSLPALADGVIRGGWPDRSVFITFDDGLRSVADHALPALLGEGMTATVFVVAGAIRPGGDPPVLCGPAMDAAAIRDVAAAGLTVGAHGMTHRALGRLAPADQAREIQDSQRLLEDVLGAPVRSFAYPFGDAPAAARQLVREHYDAGFGVTMGMASVRSAPEHLERIDAHYLRWMTRVDAIDRGPLNVYLAVRAMGRRVRQCAMSRIQRNRWSRRTNRSGTVVGR